MFETIQTTSTWITWTILHFIWMGFAVWFLAQAYRFLFPSTRSHKLYRANLIGLLALVSCLPIAAIFGAWHLETDGSSRLNAIYMPIVSTAGADPKPTVPSAPNRSKTNEDSQQNAAIATVGIHDNAKKDSEQANPTVLALSPARASVSINKTISKMAPLIAVCYLAGMALMMCRLMMMVVGCRRIKDEAFTDDNSEFLGRLSVIAKKLGVRTPSFRLTTRVSSPMVVGLLKPMLLIPASLISGMTTAELDAVLIHELAHLQRYDHFVVLFQRVTEAIFFFHPAVWHFSRGLGRTRELCCDDIVLEQGTQPLDYARGLCHVAEFSNNKKVSTIALAATGESPGELLGRVRRVLGDSAKVKMGPSRFAALTMAIMILSSAVAISVFAIAPPVDYELINSLRSVPPQEQAQVQNDGFAVKGRVFDEAGKPVAFASVRGSQATNLMVHSSADEKGEFEIEFPP